MAFANSTKKPIKNKNYPHLARILFWKTGHEWLAGKPRALCPRPVLTVACKLVQGA
ncbi:MAG: hypothetical protein KAJ24_04260 [Candidatus Aenigmarchaeota archaeon]|nr:hypothetical protein [Candidatus Aenigmarchaeota archaeon]